MKLPGRSADELLALLTNVLSAQPQATAILDGEGRVLGMDPRAAELFRVRVGREVVIGEPLLAALEGRGAETVAAALAEVREGRLARFEHMSSAAVYDVTAAPMPDGNVCVTLATVDPRRVAAEAQLRQREAQLRQAMEAARIVPWEWQVGADVVRRALDVSITGVPPENLTMFLKQVHPEDRPVVRDALEATLRDDAPYAVTYRKQSDGQTLWLDARAFLVRDAEGRPQKLVGVVVDFTERRRLEDQLVQSQKMDAVGRLAGGVAHDFNNVLTAIMTSSHMLSRRVGERPELRDITEAAERASNLTRQLLAFGRRQILRPTVMDLGGVVDGMVGLLRRIVGEDIELETRAASDLRSVRGDETQIEQVVMNLAVNARDAMPKGGVLALALENVDLGATVANALGVAPGPYVRLRVRDSGVGIDATARARLFEPFFTTKGPGAGTGLGLATVYGIVTQLGGAVSVDSQPGAGATFDVYFPSSDDRVTPSQRHPSAGPRGGSAEATETILLVEDEPSVRRSTRLLLETAGYRVLEADDGETAVDLARQRPDRIDLLVTDVVMPRSGGVATAERVLAIHPETKVIFVTGYADDAIVRHGVAGDVTLVRKPYAPDALFGAIRRTLEASGA